jgi:DNA-binding helix-hairpin-helix protein with protein kinase domain
MAFCHLHSRGSNQGDLDPNNILVDKMEEFLLGDCSATSFYDVKSRHSFSDILGELEGF